MAVGVDRMEVQPEDALEDNNETRLESAIGKVLELKFRPPFSHHLRQQMWEERKQLYDNISLEKKKMFRSRNSSKEEKDAFKMRNLNAWINLYSKQRDELQEMPE